MSKQIEWILDKATPNIVLSKQSITLDSDNLTDTFTVTTNSTGNLSVVSSDDAIVTASLSGNTVTVEGLTNGDTIITISIAEDDNYLSNNITLSATCNLVSTTLNDNTPSAIQSAVANGQASSLWSVGDTIDITLSGTVGSVTLSGTYRFAILGIDHNNVKELPSDKSHSLHLGLSKNSSGTEIAFTDWTNATFWGNRTSSTSYFIHNGSGNFGCNIGGWEKSNMRTNICANFLNCLPSEWQNVITAITKYTDNKGNAEYGSATATTDTIWLLAEFEIFNYRRYSNPSEQNSQEQYAYYKNGNSTIRYGHQQTSTKVCWWERSPYCEDVTGNGRQYRTEQFCFVYENGSYNCMYANTRMGFVPCFAICG